MQPFNEPDWIANTTIPVILETQDTEPMEAEGSQAVVLPDSLPTVGLTADSHEIQNHGSVIDRRPASPLQKRGWWQGSLLAHGVVVTIALLSGIVTSLELGSVDLLERQTQTFFWQLRSPTRPPENIVILAIDEYSLELGNLYAADPKNLADFKALKTWPWPRSVYATVADRLIQAGAKAVAIDLVFASPSLYGPQDDQQLQRVMKKYPGKITLAASYEESETRSGSLIHLVQPHSALEVPASAIGSISYLIEADGRIHQFADAYPEAWIRQNPRLGQEFLAVVGTVPSFEQAVLKATGLSPPAVTNHFIFFYGPSGTFPRIPFSDVLDRQAWNSHLQKGQFFKNKIILIGPTATLFQDNHRTPVSENMPGVEINANAIATLIEGRAIAKAIPNPHHRGLLTVVIVLGAGYLLSQRKSWWGCMGSALGMTIVGYGFTYVLFGYGQLLLPTALPSLAIVLSGGCYSTLCAIQESRRRRKLRKTFKRYVSAPIVQEILAQQDDFQDLIQESDQEILGRVLKDRYKVTKKLSSGGFGATYLAQDTQRPGHPQCVVKQLQPLSNNPKVWRVAKQLFLREAEILEVLGKHPQIPQLLAYFEQDEEFYLVEEWIVGHLLSHELSLVIPHPEIKTLSILQGLLTILEFVHSYNVIHRDLKPENIIRRHSDQKLVLIDFGAVKEIQDQFNDSTETTNLTMAIGTRGYIPNEQAAGKPQFSSDLYAAGMIAIQILTGLHPRYLKEDSATGELNWQGKTRVSLELTTILNRLVRTNVRDRYQSATEVLRDLQPLVDRISPELWANSALVLGVSSQSISTSDLHDSTVIWIPSDADDSGA